MLDNFVIFIDKPPLLSRNNKFEMKIVSYKGITGWIRGGFPTPLMIQKHTAFERTYHPVLHHLLSGSKLFSYEKGCGLFSALQVKS
jgi:hypothetical protein